MSNALSLLHRLVEIDIRQSLYLSGSTRSRDDSHMAKNPQDVAVFSIQLICLVTRESLAYTGCM